VAYNVQFAPEAIADLKRMRAFDRAAVVDTISRVLRTGPTQLGQSRIKRLRGLDSPQYRLRVGENRVFYDVSEAEESVRVLRVLSKADVDDYLKEMGYEA
jgi:mRNA-degrading endonuclease RelE of RelBE toxin-antitoxin system